jgi:hypothetical protein
VSRVYGGKRLIVNGICMVAAVCARDALREVRLRGPAAFGDEGLVVPVGGEGYGYGVF